MPAQNYQILATAAVQKWEYKTVILPDIALMKDQNPAPMMDKFGVEGWELVTITMAEAFHNRFYTLWFKRPIPDPK